MNKLSIILVLIIATSIFAQTEKDSIHSENEQFDITKLNSLKTDWTVLNSPLLIYSTNSARSNHQSLYSLYTNSQMNSGLSITQPDEMLNQFQLANNWEAKKKYGVFAKYLGIAQLMGAIGIAAVSISNQNNIPKSKVKTKSPRTEKP
ncbi:MAG: hypothetical protein PF445_07745 [Melioribacteraceae bacterium]|jgi:hypothetical protein|nr:hypothetical protein [Melioribacteraceae bacterium]